MEKKYLGELEIADEFLKVARDNLSLSLRTSANRLYFSFERAVGAYLMFVNGSNGRVSIGTGVELNVMERLNVFRSGENGLF